MYILIQINRNQHACGFHGPFKLKEKSRKTLTEINKKGKTFQTKWCKNYANQIQEYTVPASAKKWYFSHFNEVSSLIQINIHRDWSRNIFWKCRKIQKFITSLFLNIHFVGIVFLFFWSIWWIILIIGSCLRISDLTVADS